MKKNVLIFGLVLSIILCINMILMVNLMYSNPDYRGNDFLGYASMLVIYSLIYFGVRNYRNKELKGIISFGKAFKTGLLITLMASVSYVIVWLFYYYLFVPDFIEVYSAHVIKNCTPEDDISAKITEMAELKENYKNPLFVILVTFSEVFPVGLIVTLLSAFILKRKPNNITN